MPRATRPSKSTRKSPCPRADDDHEEFQLPDDDSDSESGGPPAQLILDRSDGLLTQSDTLCTDTVDSNTERPVSDIVYFFKEFVDDEGVTMRRCNACL